MKLRYENDNWDYGIIGEKVRINGAEITVGSTYEIRHRMAGGNWKNSECIVVNKLDEIDLQSRRAFFMGLGDLMPDEFIGMCVREYRTLKIGKTIVSLLVTDK